MEISQQSVKRYNAAPFNGAQKTSKNQLCSYLQKYPRGTFAYLRLESPNHAFNFASCPTQSHHPMALRFGRQKRSRYLRHTHCHTSQGCHCQLPEHWRSWLVFLCHLLPSLKLTYPLKIDPWKRRFLLETHHF